MLVRSCVTRLGRWHRHPCPEADVSLVSWCQTPRTPRAAYNLPYSFKPALTGRWPRRHTAGCTRLPLRSGARRRQARTS